jgi:hypothetical protein
MPEKITWPVVAMIGLVLTSVVVLGVTGADTSTITNVLIALGLGGGLGVMQGIKNNVNGNLAILVKMLGEAMDRLARAQPVGKGDGDEAADPKDQVP